MIAELRDVVGRRWVITDPAHSRPFRTGYRYGGGDAAAVVRPGSLVELWRVVLICARHDAAIIMQAANTGLTGGSTPVAGMDRPVVVVNVMRLAAVFPIDDGRQVVCLPGATLDRLERLLAPLGREPHSVIGSSCLGASVIGGICNNSGGALVRRGPAYTELALFARIGEDGAVTLVNHLGIALGDDPETMLARLDRGDFTATDIGYDPAARASDRDYADYVRDVDAPTPARFNADPRRLFEAAGSAGKLVVFAVRLDTFEKPAANSVFYVGTNNVADLTMLRRALLTAGGPLPIAAEYIHRDAFRIAADYGRDTYLAIRLLGTQRLPMLARLRDGVDRWAARFGARQGHVADRVLQRLSSLLPPLLPRRLRDYGDRFEHHLILRVEAAQEEATVAMLDAPGAGLAWFACDEAEGAAAFLHRFSVAGAAARYRLVHRQASSGIVALDYALPRNTVGWFVDLAGGRQKQIVAELRYGHFLCHVIHHDFVAAPGVDCDALEQAMVATLEDLGAACPAEHNVGHIYTAGKGQEAFFRTLDPGNRLNPGVGRMSRRRDYAPDIRHSASGATNDVDKAA